MQRVSSLKQARAVLAAGERDLVTEPFAACHAGVNYWWTMLEQLRQEFGAVRLTLCCGDDAAIAHDALRLGFTQVICDCGEQPFTELQSIAAPLQATIHRRQEW